MSIVSTNRYTTLFYGLHAYLCYLQIMGHLRTYQFAYLAIAELCFFIWLQSLLELKDWNTFHPLMEKEFSKRLRSLGLEQVGFYHGSTVYAGSGGIIFVKPYYAPGVRDENFGLIMGPHNATCELSTHQEMIALRKEVTTIIGDQVPIYCIALFSNSTFLTCPFYNGKYYSLTLRDNMHLFIKTYISNQIFPNQITMACKKLEESA